MRAIDTETTGLYPPKAELLCKAEAAIDGATPGIVGHNLKFDLHMMAAAGSTVRLDVPWWDTKVMAQLVGYTRTSLAELSKKILKIEKKEVMDLIPHKGRKKGALKDVPIAQLQECCNQHAQLTKELYLHFIKKYPKLWESDLWRIEERILKLLWVAERQQLNLDIPGLEAFKRGLEKGLPELEEALRGLIRRPELNLRSPAQMRQVFYKYFRLPVLRKTVKGAPAVDIKVVDMWLKRKLTPQITLWLEKYKEYKEKYKLYTAYVCNILNNQIDNRMQANFNSAEAGTGRMSSSKPFNWQNLPARKGFQTQFRQYISAKKGHIFYSIDHSQVELRMLAHFAGGFLLRAYQHDEDVHKQTAQILFNKKEVSDKQRAFGKTFNFAISYGASPRRIEVLLAEAYTKDELQKLCAEYNQPDIRKLAQFFFHRYWQKASAMLHWKYQVIDLAEYRGYVKTILGRKRYINFETDDRYLRGKAERQAVNTIIQGSATADLIKLCLVYAQREIDRTNVHAHLAMVVHDEAIYQVKDTPKNRGQFEKLIDAAFVRLPKQYLRLRVPLKVDVHTGYNLKELKQ